MALTTEQKANIVALRGLGRSYQTIAEEVGAAKDTVIKVCEQEDTSVRACRREMVEEVVLSHRLLLRDRLESLGRFASRLREELETRNLAEVSTPAVAKMYLDTLKAIQSQSPLFVQSHEYYEGWPIEDHDMPQCTEGGPRLYQKSTDLRAIARLLYGGPKQIGETNGEVWHGEEAKEETGRV